MDELVPVLSLVLGYRVSLVVGPVYDRYCQVFYHTLDEHSVSLLLEVVSVMLTCVCNMDERAE